MNNKRIVGSRVLLLKEVRMELWHHYFVEVVLLAIITLLGLWLLDLQKLVRKLGGNPAHVWINGYNQPDEGVVPPSQVVEKESVVTDVDPDPEVSGMKAEELALQARETSVAQAQHGASQEHGAKVIPIVVGHHIAAERDRRRLRERAPWHPDTDDKGPFSD